MFSYGFLAGDDALPDHEVDGPIRQGLRLGHEALQETKKRTPLPLVEQGEQTN
jgi:hypothetical protein